MRNTKRIAKRIVGKAMLRSWADCAACGEPYDDQHGSMPCPACGNWPGHVKTDPADLVPTPDDLKPAPNPLMR